ncbi:MAG: hypothetical protein LBG80_06350 [Bacteroidales bacterium]|jgi:hypothetical protein|nr:hypothetical protein [Bacteroidales bacterium]
MNNNSNQTNSSKKENNAISDRLLIEGKSYTIPKLEQKIVALEDEVANAKDEIKDRLDDLIRLKSYLREISLMQQFDKFIERKADIVKKAVYLNKCLLHFVVKSYYDDIHRYKDYCGSKWVNSHKQAAYTIKWIVKFKPIQIRENYDSESVLTNEIIDINLIFALVCAFAFLDRNSVDLIFSEKKAVDNYNLSLQIKNQEKEGKQSFYDKLLYNLRYRPFSGKHLIAIFESLELQCSKNA